MLNNNIVKSSYIDYKATLKQKTSNWGIYTGEIDIIDEKTIYNLMQYITEPTKKKPSSPL